MSTIRNQILAIIAKEAHVEPERVTLDASLQDLAVSSLEILEILFAIEEHFNITLPDRDPSFETTSVGGLVKALERFVLDSGFPDASAVAA